MNLAIVLLPAWRIVSFLAMIHLTTNRQYKRLSELAVKLFGYTAIFIIMFALAIYSVESSEPGAMIRDLPTAYWWTFTTLATVGYGDVYPITGIGRVIAVVVMLYGVGMVAVATGALASWIIEKIGGREEQEYPATKADVDDLRQEISELRALLAREYARREAHDYTLREVVDEDGVHPVPSEAEAARRTGLALLVLPPRALLLLVLLAFLSLPQLPRRRVPHRLVNPPILRPLMRLRCVSRSRSPCWRKPARHSRLFVKSSRCVPANNRSLRTVAGLR